MTTDDFAKKLLAACGPKIIAKRFDLTVEDLAYLQAIRSYHGYETIDQAARHAIRFAGLCYDQSPYSEGEGP